MEHNVNQNAPNVVSLNSFEIPDDMVIKLHIPKFWLKKNKAKTIELAENSVTGNLEIKVVEKREEES